MCRPSRGITGLSKMKETLRSPNQTVKQESRQKPVDTLGSGFFCLLFEDKLDFRTF